MEFRHSGCSFRHFGRDLDVVSVFLPDFPKSGPKFGQRDTFHRSRNPCRRHRNAPFDETEVQPKFNVIKKNVFMIFFRSLLAVGPICAYFDHVLSIFGYFWWHFVHFWSFLTVLDPFLACVTHLSGFGGPYRGVGWPPRRKRVSKMDSVCFKTPQKSYVQSLGGYCSNALAVSLAMHIFNPNHVSLALQQCSSG